MREIFAEIQDRLRALAAALTAIRGRLEELSSELPEEEPAGEGEESCPSLRSLISCVLTDSLDIAIRDLLSAAEQEPKQVADRTSLEGRAYGAVMARIDRALPHLLAVQERERREAEELFLDLASVGGEEREAALADERFHRTLVLGKLLEEAGSALPEAPARAEEFAALAAAVAAHLPDVIESMEGRARAACRQAQARRLAGNLAGAERALAEAALYPGDADVQAELCRAIALLRWEQGRNAEAAALLDRAAVLWAEEEVPHEEGACRVLRALLLVEEGRAAEVVGLLQSDLPLLTDPWLTLYGGLALALGLADRGLEAKARATRDESAALAHRSPLAAHFYALRQKGAIAASLGEFADAEALFEELRLAALEHRLLPEATAATIALVRLDVERLAKREPVRQRTEALAATFSGIEGLDGLVAMLEEVPRRVSAAESPGDLTATLIADVLRLFRLRGVQSAPLPFT